ncbi:hypothetical protein, partial [Parvibaculum sp.]|uniref:hypothetical protein n=1 Tax=Parvibaculum sp. TaxID=2024848 RepID=UPI002C4B99BF
CVAPLWSANAHMLTVDIPMTSVFFMTLSVIVRRPDLWRLASVLAGCAAAIKYPGALALSGIWAVFFVEERSVRLRLLRSIEAGAIAFATFLFFNPFIILDMRDFSHDFFLEIMHSRVGHPGFTVENGFSFHLLKSIPMGFGLIGYLAALAGLGVFTVGFPRLAARVAILVPMILFVVVIGMSRLGFVRYALPLLPFAALFFGLAFSQVQRLLAGTIHPVWGDLGVCLFAAALIGPIWQSSRQVELLTKADTREISTDILEKASIGDAKTDYSLAATTRWVDQAQRRWTHFFNVCGGKTRPCTVSVVDSFELEQQPYTAAQNARFKDQWKKLIGAVGVLQINPYSSPIDDVTLDRENIYSAYGSELPFRRLRGPLIEIYIYDPQYIAALRATCAHYPSCTFLQGSQARYGVRLAGIYSREN